MRRVTTALLSLLLLAACVGPGTDASGAASSNDPDGSSQTATLTPAPSETAGESASAAPEPEGWTEVARFEEADTRATVHEVVVTNDGFVAIGQRSTTEYLGAPGVPRLWRSADGRSWEEAAPDLGHPDAIVVGGSVLDDGSLLLVGSTGDIGAGDPYEPRAWSSTDLEAWTELDVPFAESASAVDYDAGPRGHVVAAGDALWHSTDGREWQEVFDAGGDYLGSVEAGEEGFIVVSVPPDAATTTVLASGDGIEWFESEEGDVRPAPFGPDWLGSVYRAEDPPTIELVRSGNGLDWEVTHDVNDITPADGPKAGQGMESEIQQVTFTAAGGLAVMTFSWNHCCAQLPQGVMVLSSTDATEWTEVDLGADAFVTASSANDELIVLAGYVNRGQAVTFWISERGE